MRSYPVIMRFRNLFFSVLVLSFNLSTSYGIELTDTTDKIQPGTRISIVAPLKSKPNGMNAVRFYQGEIVDKNHKPSPHSNVYCFLMNVFSGDFEFSTVNHGPVGTGTEYGTIPAFCSQNNHENRGFYCYNVTGGKITVKDILETIGDHIKFFPPNSKSPLTIFGQPPARGYEMPPLDSDPVLKLPVGSRLVLKQDLKIGAHDNQIRFFQGQAVAPNFDYSQNKSQDPVHAALWVKEVKKLTRIIPSKPAGENCGSRSCLQLEKASSLKIETTLDGKKGIVPGTIIPIKDSNNFASLVCYKPSGDQVTIEELKAAFSDVLAFYEEPPSNEIEISHEEHKVDLPKGTEETDEGRPQGQGTLARLAPHPSFAPQQGAGIGNSPSAPPGGAGTY